MISKHTIASSADAANYHREAWDKSEEKLQSQATGSEEYYARDQVPSAWGGTGAAYASFGIGEAVSKEDFIAALDGKLRNGDGSESKLGKWTTGEDGEKVWTHRAGIDFTFSPSKSVSEAATIGGDERVTAAIQANVERAMQYAEQHCAILHQGGETRNSGNLLYAKFEHDTARPVTGQDGQAVIDPQKHVHVVIVNGTYNTETGRWQGLSNEKLLDHRQAMDAVFQTGLARDMQALGYQIDRFGQNGVFEIKQVSQHEIDHFSGRSAQIERGLQETHGIDKAGASWEARDAATQATRAHKVEITRGELQGQWETRAAAIGSSIHETVAAARANAPGYDRAAEQAAGVSAVRKGIEHLATSEQVFLEKDLVRAAAEFSYGRTTYDDIANTIQQAKADGLLIDRGEGLYTTPAAIAREHDFVRAMVQGQGVMSPLSKDPQALAAAMAELDKAKGFELNDGQRQAVRMIMEGTDKHLAVNGDPGTGKTTMLQDAYKLATAQGVEVRGFAAGSNAAAVLHHETGMRTATIAQFLADLGKAERAGYFRGAAVGSDIKEIVEKYGLDGARQLYVIDEAGMISQADASRIERYAAMLPGAQVIWNGDINQIQNPAAGDPFRQAIEGGVRTAQLDEIRRQKDDVGQAATRDAVANFKGTEKGDVLHVEAVNANTGNRAVAPGQADIQAGTAAADWARVRNERTGHVLRINLPEGHGITAGELLHVEAKGDREYAEIRVRDHEQITVARPDGEKVQIRAGIRAAFDRLEKVEISDNRGLVSRIAGDYAALEAGQRDKTLVMTETNADRRAINSAIREELRARTDQLQGTDSQREILVDRRLTDTQKVEANSYRTGDVLRIEGNYKDPQMLKGDYLRVDAIDAGRNTVSATNERTGHQVQVNLNERTQITAYRAEQAALAVGDRIRFNKPDKEAGITNGTVGTVEKIKESGELTVRVSDKQTIDVPAANRHFDHAYCTTSYGVQGKTGGEGWVHNNPQAGGGGERNNLVNFTRAQNGTRIYSTDLAATREAIGREANKSVSIDARHAGEQIRAEVPAEKIQAGQDKTQATPERSRPTVSANDPKHQVAERPQRDIDLAKSAIDTYERRGVPPADMKVTERLRDSEGRLYLRDNKGDIHSASLREGNVTHSKNINHLGLTETKYAIVRDTGLRGALGGTTVIKSGGSLLSEAAGRMRESLNARGTGSGVTDRVLARAENWREAGVIESAAVRARIALENRAERAEAIKDLRSVAASPSREERALARAQDQAKGASQAKGQDPSRGAGKGQEQQPSKGKSSAEIKASRGAGKMPEEKAGKGMSRGMR